MAAQLGAKAGPGITKEKVRKLLTKGLSYSEIGRKLDISAAAVGKHARRLRSEAERKEGAA